MENFTFVDLFCGIGGFHQAMTELGGTCVYASDIDPYCRAVYEKNYGLIPQGDITKVDAADIPAHNVLCAGFPCQSFSKAGKRLGFADETKGTLFFDILRIAKYHQPEYMILENVRNLATHDKGNTWRVIHDSLEDIGYNIPDKPIVFSPHYLGIPQHRERVYIMCKRKDLGEIKPFAFDITHLPQCNIESILQDDSEINNLDKYKLSEKQIELINLWNEFIQNIKCEKLPTFPLWSEYYNRYTPRQLLYDLPSWKINIIVKNMELYNKNTKFLCDWMSKARWHELFFGSKAKLEWQVGDTKNPNIWDNIIQFRPSGIRVKPGTYFPALVAITQTSIVGKRKRFITPRECARLQSFPDTFICDPSDARAYKQFGNSVNIECVKLFAKHLLK